MGFPQRLVLVVLCAAGMFPTAWAASPSPPDEGDCDDYYFGITQAPDFSKALKCYQDEKRWALLILMHLNGEGTPVDVRKAEELLHAWQKADPTNSLQTQALRQAIDERKQHPGVTYPRIIFCDGVGANTVTMNACAALSDDIEDIKLKVKMAKVRARMTPAQAAIFGKVLAEFAAFKDAEIRRMYQQSIDGTIRRLASLAQAAFVRDQFSTLIEETVERRALKPANKEAYEAADRELNQVYRDDIRDYTREHEERIGHTKEKDQIDIYRRYIDDYNKDSKETQIHWIRYRDLCAELARSLYKSQKGALDPALSMKTAITRIRVIELRHDPIGPGPGE